MTLRLRAPAKTNLFLEVLRRREDGFHELDTVFAELDLADELEFELSSRPGIELTIEGDPGLSAGPENLVIRAGEGLRAGLGARGQELGARILLRKRIPQGGGLGGGSSDAAAALRGLDELWGLATAPPELARQAARLGSDVAFFLEGGFARGLERGEVLSPVAGPPRALAGVLALPGFPCPTPAVYGALAKHLPSQPRDPQALLAALEGGDVEKVGAALFNRLQAPALELFPVLEEIRARLAAAPESLGVLLSGSGSTFLVLCAEANAAKQLASRLTESGLRALATQTAVS